MQEVYKSLKSNGNTKLFLKQKFFDARIITLKEDNSKFEFFDINDANIKYAYSNSIANDGKESRWFYLRQSEISKLAGNLNTTGIDVSGEIRFSNTTPKVDSLSIKALSKDFPDSLKNTIKEYGNEIFISNDYTNKHAIYINSISNLDNFIPKDNLKEINSGAGAYLSLQNDASNSKIEANTINLTGTSVSSTGYVQNSNSTKLMGYGVSGSIITYEESIKMDNKKIYKINFSNQKYILSLTSKSLIENPLSIVKTDAPNILNLTCGNAVKYVEYDANNNINCPDNITSPTGVYIRRSGNGFIVYTPTLREEA